jgi:hypothetical protein
MPTIETPTYRLAVSIVGLRKGREGLARLPQPRDRFTIKARIDIYDELINSVEEIDQSLRRLSSHAQRGRPMAPIV